MSRVFQDIEKKCGVKGEAHSPLTSISLLSVQVQVYRQEFPVCSVRFQRQQKTVLGFRKCDVWKWSAQMTWSKKPWSQQVENCRCFNENSRLFRTLTHNQEGKHRELLAIKPQLSFNKTTQLSDCSSKCFALIDRFSTLHQVSEFLFLGWSESVFGEGWPRVFREMFWMMKRVVGWQASGRFTRNY
jgi:hypothetical protein